MKIKTLGVASSLAIMACLSAPAYAQNQTGEASTGTVDDIAEDTVTEGRNNTIIVTAEFREANVQDTPIAITAVNAEMLEARGQTDIAAVAAQAPNVTLKPQPQGGGSGLIAFIRGVGQVDFNYALDPGVGVYIDDVYIPTLSGSLLELIDLDRVEILRGPQGTLAGKNSIGGAIKLFSAKPEGSGEGSLRAEYGSYDMISLRGMADFAITDNVFARVSGTAQSRDGHVALVDYSLTHPNDTVPSTNARGRGNFDYETMGGESLVATRLALRFLPTDRLEINVSGDYTRDRSEANAAVLLAAGAVSATAANFDPDSANPATDANGNAWLPGTDGNPVPVDCRFVPYGQYSCDTANLEALGYDPRFVSYADFLDSKVPTQQAPYKPYFTLPIREFTGWGVHGNLTFDLTDNFQFVYIGSYREYTSKWGEDQDVTPVPVAQLDNQLDHSAWSSEVRLNFELLDGFADGTVGGYYLDQSGEYTARVDLNYAGIDFIHGPDTTPSTTKALFGTLSVYPTEAMSITGGIRYTKDKKVYTYYRSNPDGTVPFVENGSLLGPTLEVAPGVVIPTPSVCEFFLGAPTAGPTGIGNTPNCLLSGLFGISDSFIGDRIDWRIAADYRFSESFLAYASVSTGFKGGGVNPRPFFGPSAGECNAAGYQAPNPCNQLRSFNPETITTYEVGFKSDLLDRRLRVNGAAFFNKYEDIILQLSACPSIPCLQPRNVGAADVKGAELEITAFPVDGLSIDAALSYIDFEYTSPTAFDTLRGYEALADEFGNSIGVPADAVTPFTPKWTWNVGLQYDWELASNAVISARVDGAYQSEIYSESLNTVWSQIPGYFLANGRLAYTSPDEDWTVAARVDNILDKYYFLTKSDVTTALGLVTGAPGLPRTWSVSVERRFGPSSDPVPDYVAPPLPQANYKQCLDNTVVAMDAACPPPATPAAPAAPAPRPAPPAPAPAGERG